MGDLQGRQPDLGAGPAEQLDPHIRLIGDRAYLLVEFTPGEQDVELALSCWGIDCDESEEGFASALEDVLAALRDHQV